MRQTFPLWAICIGLLIWDAVQLGKAGGAASEGDASTSWPTAPGKVTRSSVGTLAVGGKVSHDEYTANIDYDYTVGTMDHVGHRIRFTVFDRKTAATADDDVAKYRVGTAVTVYYDPDQPDEAVLEPGAPTVNWQRKVIGVACVALAFGAAAIVIQIVVARRRRRRLYG